jgi:hypothetical protein
VVSRDTRRIEFLNERDALIREWAVPDEIARYEESIGTPIPENADGSLERGQVGVNVRQNAVSHRGVSCARMAVPRPRRQGAAVFAAALAKGGRTGLPV